MKTEYRNLIKQTNYPKLVIAAAVNAFGDCFDSFALSWLVYSITGSKLYFALNFAINALPNLIIQPLIGVVIERMSKKKVMIIADLLRAGLVLCLIVLNSTQEINPFVVMGFTFLMTCCEAFRQPAASSIMPQVIDIEVADYAVSLNSTIVTFSNIIGTALAGVVVSQWGVNAALIIDFISFVVSAAVLSRLVLKPLSEMVQQTSYFIQLKEGFNYFKTHKFISKIAFIGAAIQFFIMGFNVLLTPFVVETIGYGPEFVSFYSVFQLVAMIAGTLSYPIIHKKYQNYICFAVGGVAFSISLISMSFLRAGDLTWVFAAIIAAVGGFGIGLFQGTLSSSFITSIEPHIIGRTSALFNSVIYASIPLGSMAVGGLITVLPMEVILLVYAIILLLIFILFTRNKEVRDM